MRIESQISFDFTGEQLAEAGLGLAVETANKKEKDWSTKCWQLFLWWLRKKPRHHEFKVEDFRKHLDEFGLIDPPPSLRAYGFISKRALKGQYIEFAGTAKVTNPKAHATPVNVWRKK